LAAGWVESEGLVRKMKGLCV